MKTYPTYLPSFVFISCLSLQVQYFSFQTNENELQTSQHDRLKYLEHSLQVWLNYPTQVIPVLMKYCCLNIYSIFIVLTCSNNAPDHFFLIQDSVYCHTWPLVLLFLTFQDVDILKGSGKLLCIMLLSLFILLPSHHLSQ